MSTTQVEKCEQVRKVLFWSMIQILKFDNGRRKSGEGRLGLEFRCK